MRRCIAIATVALTISCGSQTADTPTVAPPRDRDGAAVVAALRRVDACALVDRAVASRAGFGAQPAVYPEAPHSCTVSSAPSSGSDEVQIRLGAQVEHFQKWSAAPITVAGAKAYLRDESLERDQCAIYLPVSFTRAIWIGTRWGTSTRSIPELCAVTRSFAVAAVVRLVADPGSLRADRRRLPLSEWDGCSLLAGALGDTAGQYTVKLDEGVPGLDGCEASAGGDHKLTLKISYGWDPATAAGAKRKQISGRTADILELVTFGGDYLGCMVRWSNGTATGIRVLSDQVLEVKAPDCSQAESLAVAVMATLRTTPSAAGVQRRLLYRPDEPDTTATGPCIDDVDGDKPGRCAPYHEVPVPGDKQEIITAANSDPNIECALALNAVRTHLGAQMHPTTDGSSCHFLEPTHTVDLEVDSSGFYRPDEYGDDPGLFRNRKKIDVAGHPAIYFEAGSGRSRNSYEIYASPGSDTSAPGFVNIRMDLSPPRGTPSGSPIDTTRAALVEKIAADILSTHFH